MTLIKIIVTLGIGTLATLLKYFIIGMIVYIYFKKTNQYISKKYTVHDKALSHKLLSYLVSPFVILVTVKIINFISFVIYKTLII